MTIKKQTPPAPVTKPKSPSSSSWKGIAGVLSLFVVVLLILFWKSTIPGWTLASGDGDQLAVERSQYDTLPWSHIARWDPVPGLGTQNGLVPLAPGYLLTYLIPASKYDDANYFFNLLLLGLFSFLLLYDLTRNRAASLLGGIWMMLQPHVLSHILPGHIGHLMMMGWIPGVFWLLRRAVKTDNWVLWGLTGILFGIALNSTVVDVGFFWALLLAAYGIFLIIQKLRAPPAADLPIKPDSALKTYGRLSRNILLAAVLAVMTGYQAIVIVIGMESRAQPSSPDISQQNPEQARLDKWFWATQWSVPVEEVLDCAIPGFFGWGSSNAQNPYRGRVGQTEGFPLHRQGMPNLNDVSIYLGATILLACLIAFYLNRRSGELWFFALAAIITCLLTFGKYAPFYKLFFLLPKMDAIRNPIKWFYLTSFCVGIAGTIGIDQALKQWANPFKGVRIPWLLTLLVFPILLILGYGSWFLKQIASDPNALYWQYPALRQLSADSLVTGGFIWILAAGAFAWCLWPRKNTAESRSILWPALLIGAIMLGELVQVNRHYLPYKSSDTQINGGPLADYLNNQPRPFRIKIAGQEPIFQYIRQRMTLYYQWEHIEPTVSRTLDDFTLFSQALAGNPQRLFQMTNVRYIIGPAGFKDPLMKLVQSLSAGQTAVAIYQFTEPLARYYLVPSWRYIPATERFKHLNDPDFYPAKEALVHVASPDLPPPPEPRARQMSCRIDQYRWSYIKLKVETDQPALLVGLDRFDADWHATIDGREVPIHLADGMMRACWIDKGQHTVEFKLIGLGWRPLLIVLAGWVTGFLLLGVLAITQWTRSRKQPIP